VLSCDFQLLNATGIMMVSYLKSSLLCSRASASSAKRFDTATLLLARRFSACAAHSTVNVYVSAIEDNIQQHKQMHHCLCVSLEWDEKLLNAGGSFNLQRTHLEGNHDAPAAQQPIHCRPERAGRLSVARVLNSMHAMSEIVACKLTCVCM